MKNLPYISISGTLQELIEIETHLAFYYDQNLEEWNNNQLETSIRIKSGTAWIVCNEGRQLMYLSHDGVWVTKENSFHASQLTEILNYIENYK